MNDFLAVLISVVALWASLWLLRRAWRRPRVVRLYYRAKDVRLEVGRCGKVNVEGVDLGEMLLTGIEGRPHKDGWLVTAQWRLAEDVGTMRRVKR